MVLWIDTPCVDKIPISINYGEEYEIWKTVLRTPHLVIGNSSEQLRTEYAGIYIVYKFWSKEIRRRAGL
jgi:hypothetical protein